ncbi:MAG: hypothetical protein KDK70_14315 [Myxococcales bacterium]|nr:hypothetical protein [Myxococcales bacterium]
MSGRWDPLLVLAAPHAGGGRAGVDALTRGLVGVPWSGSGRPRSILNNDGIPLQLSISSGAEGVGVRLIGDPHTGLPPSRRFGASVHSAQTLLDATGSAGLRSLVQATIQRTLPEDDLGRSELPHGALWLAAAVDGRPGMALYTTLDWGPTDAAARWQRVHGWLGEILPAGSSASRWLVGLSEAGVPTSAALEGSTLADARAKVYARLLGPTPFGRLGLEGLTDPRMLRFVELALAGRAVARLGLVLSASFSVATGELADVKVDICGHCIPRSASEWQGLCAQLSRSSGVRPIGIEAALTEHDVGVAFIGMGRKRSGQMRMNLYLKSTVPVA